MAAIDPPEGEASEAEAEGIDSFKPFLVHTADRTVVADYPVGVFFSLVILTRPLQYRQWL